MTGRYRVFAHPSGEFLGYAFGTLNENAPGPVRAEKNGDMWWVAILSKGVLVTLKPPLDG